MQLIAVFARFTARLWLAVRYWIALDYSWHLAWTKAERK